MIDLHCHLLPNIDDGSKSIQETIELIKHAVNSGFDTICFTPHYAEPQYVSGKEKNEKILFKIKNELKNQNIKVNLYLGNEVFINDKMLKFIEEKKITTLADTDYILVELPMYQEMPQEIVQSFIGDLLNKKYNVIIAHPERYRYIQANPKKIFDYFNEDVIFQGNYASILGYYGRDAQKTIKKFLKWKKISYFATDTHQIDRCIYDDVEEIKKKLHKIVDKEYFDVLTEINPRLIIENKEIVSKEK